MIEVFITDIPDQLQADRISRIIQRKNAGLKLSFDLNETEFPFPWTHHLKSGRHENKFKQNFGDRKPTRISLPDFGGQNLYTKRENMTEFWEEAFKDKQEMWGLKPAQSAVWTKDFFVENKVKIVLIPGIGYGRNAQIFRNNGMTVTGIEISQTAIDLGQKHFGDDVTIYHGSVTDMPFDSNLYDGIFCYGLIHLLDQAERAKLIRDCYNQLIENGFMVYTTITKDAPTYGQGTSISKDRFEMFGGVKIFFYDRETIKEEFGKAGLLEVTEIIENYPFYLIKCQKNQREN